MAQRWKLEGIAACVVALGSLLLAASAPAKFRGAPNSGLQSALEQIVDAPGGPPGVSVLIDRGQHSEYLWAGVADVRSDRPPTPLDHFRIASVAKAFNSYIGVKLVGNGALSFETTLKASIPGVLPAAEGVKLRELLQHTSGIAEYISTPAFGERLNADPAAYISPLELTGYARDLPLEFAPSSQYEYSDTDNIAAGLIEEAASGLNYEQLLQRRVFGPLKMPNSSLPRTIAMPRPFMHGYDIEPGKPPEDVSELINPAGAWASGGIVSTPLDLARFVRRYVPTVLAATQDLEASLPARLLLAAGTREERRRPRDLPLPDRVRHRLRPHRLLPRLPHPARRQPEREALGRLRRHLPDRSRRPGPAESRHGDHQGAGSRHLSRPRLAERLRPIPIGLPLNFFELRLRLRTSAGREKVQDVPALPG